MQNPSIASRYASAHAHEAHMPAVEYITTIRASPEAVYDLISRVEDFPRYCRAIDEVRAYAPDAYRWRVRLAGIVLGWDAQVIEARRPSAFAWRSLRGVDNAGRFALAPTAGGTEVRFSMEYRFANRLLEVMFDALAAPLVRRVAQEILEQVRARLERANSSP